MKHEITKCVESLTIADFEAFPVWEFTNRDESKFGDLEVRPVKKIPVENFLSRLVGTRVTLANSDRVFAVLGNIDSKHPRATKHFLSLTIMHGNKKFFLARYFDAIRYRDGPDALAKFLNLPIEQVFPIRYDVSKYCIDGDPAAVIGEIEKDPKEKLTRDERITLSLRPRA
jgi:hypothetical protein